MSNMLTRRQFLKEVGLVGAGVALTPMAAAGMSVDAMNALADDESPTTRLERPSWAKPSDKPTTEIDWKAMQRYDERNTCRGGLVKYIGTEKQAEWTKIQSESLAKWLKEGKSGYTLKDVALQAASGVGSATQSFLGPEKVTAPKDRGVPTWTGTPEEANEIVTAALRHLGAATVGVVELDTNTTEKLIYSFDPDGKELVFADVDQPAEEEKRRIIPRKARWAIVYTVQMSEETLKRAPTILGAQTTNLTYTRNRNIQLRLQTFLRSLGYMALGEASTNALGISPALGVVAGLGEMSRIQRLITPEYGPMVRVFKLLTDLPMAATKPINAGIMRFCSACMKCAESCPTKALSFDREPTWQTKGGWNNPGHKAYFEDSTKCREGWARSGTNCGVCFAVCPYAGKDRALIHQFVKATASATPVMNEFFKTMHDVTFGPAKPDYSPVKDPEKWWDLDLPEYGINTMQGRKNG
jgi:reductive dehalogenase